ncbi:hypothetical protein K7X08_018231 [Anisodus acutangulus]|uniref:COBRA C-terminal domain-containing protein n=1 Tax=Anisodus acutangulus TaxID=402998 RepID=A0A9Q1LVA2_9SOLA|nr:hypothetical protein K7X08_018231 [Anisodus acutangulus]
MMNERATPKNASAQAWAFKATATVLNAGIYELKNWKIFIGFQNHELLVSASTAVLVNGNDFPAPVGNGTYLAGYPQTDLKTSIDTAGDYTQIQAEVELTGTQFGVRPPGYPMPKTIKLVNDGYKCPAAIRKSTTMHVCCVKDPKFKAKNFTTKYFPRQNGDLLISYDVTQAYPSNYQAQDSTIKSSDLDFSKVLNCEKKPIIADLPPDRAQDKDVGMLPFCCRNGSIMPSVMNETNSKSVFQLMVYKLPPDLNLTALYPPEHWKIVGVLNPDYKCGQALRVDETQFSDPSGLQATVTAIASWQIVCNITKPKDKVNRCCVPYSAYYSDSAIPCSTCACGCDNSAKCNQNERSLLLPPETLLVPFANRREKSLYWAKLKHYHVPKQLPCGATVGLA